MAGIKLEFAQFGDFDTFEIYRSTSPMTIGSLPSPLVTGLTTMLYFDTSITDGVTYYYRVAAIKGGSAQVSDEISATAGFNPSLNFLSGEKGLWYDPSDFSTMFQDTGGTTPVTAVGQAVALILDKSGNSRHGVQSNSAKRPLLAQDITGKYNLHFDGVDDFLYVSYFGMGMQTSVTLYCGAKSNSDGMIVELSPNAANTPVYNGAFFIYAGTDSGNTGYESYAGGSIGSISTVSFLGTFTLPDLAVVTFTHSIPAALSTGRHNQAAGSPGTGSKGGGFFRDDQMWIGCRAGNSLFVNMDLYSLIIRSGVDDSTRISNNEGWINGKTCAF